MLFKHVYTALNVQKESAQSFMRSMLRAPLRPRNVWSIQRDSELILTSTHLSCLPQHYSPQTMQTGDKPGAAAGKQRHLLSWPGHNRSSRRKNEGEGSCHVSLSYIKRLDDMFHCGGTILAEQCLCTIMCPMSHFGRSLARIIPILQLKCVGTWRHI